MSMASVGGNEEKKPNSIKQEPPVTASDLSQVPKWVLVKLRDEMKSSLNLQQQLEKAQYDLQQAQKILDGKSEDAEAIRKLKVANYEYMVKLEESKKERERENREWQAAAADKDHKIAAAIKQINEYREAQSSNVNHKILSVHTEEDNRPRDGELRTAMERISYLETMIKARDDLLIGFGHQNVISGSSSDRSALTSSTSGNDQRNRTASEKGKKGDRERLERNDQYLVQSSIEALKSVNLYDEAGFLGLEKMHAEVEKCLGGSEGKPRKEKLQAEIADLVIRKAKMEWLLSRMEEVKKNVEAMERDIMLRRKSLSEEVKDQMAQKVIKNREKKEVDDRDNKESIQPNATLRKQVLRKISHKASLKSQHFGVETALITSSDDPGKLHLDVSGRFAAKSVSLYPMNCITKKREGDPIADRFCVSLSTNSYIMCLADGCGWGQGSRDAASTASISFVEYMKSHMKEIYKPKMCGRLALRAFQYAHKQIVKDATEETLYSTGTTTIMGAVLMPLSTPSKEGEWLLVCASIGDCKILKYSSKSPHGEVVDLTPESREDLDLRDPGGRIGPYNEGGPDLRNLDSFSCVCSEGDILMIVSDGVHDNYDPEYNAVKPAEVELHSSDNSWKNIKESKSSICKAKAEWMHARIRLDVVEALKYGDNKGVPPSSRLAELMITHAVDITKNSRNWMENMDKIVPPDSYSYPGKMDHATALIFQIPPPNKQ